MLMYFNISVILLLFTVPVKINHGFEFLHLSAEHLSARGWGGMCVCLKYATCAFK